MGKDRRPTGYSSPLTNQLMSSNNYQFGGKPPSNTLYPEVRPLFDDISQGNNNQNFGDVNKPPWQRNRDGSKSFQDRRNNPAPWNRDHVSDSWGSGPGDIMTQNQNNRQEPPWNQRNRESGNSGWREGPSGSGQRGQSGSEGMSKQESGNWGEQRGWNTRINKDEPNNMQRDSLEYDRPGKNWMDSSDGSQFNQRSGPPSEWFDRGSGWNEGNRGSGFGSALQGENVGGNRRMETGNRGEMDRGMNEGDPWWERPYDGPSRMDRSRSIEGSNWANVPRGRDIGDRDINDRYMNRSRGTGYRWDDSPGPIRPLMDTPVTEPMNQRKRVRTPDNRDVWQRQESHSNPINLTLDRVKRPRFSDPSDVRMLDMIERERHEMAFRSGYAVEDLNILDPHPSDLRDKLIRSQHTRFDKPPVTEEPDKMYKVNIIPRARFLKYKPSDLGKVEKQLIETLHKLANSENVQNLPELRFGGIKLIAKRRIVIFCMNKETAEWVLRWTPVGLRLRTRVILERDPRFLAEITFNVKFKHNIEIDLFKNFLKFQNPGLEVWNWRKGVCGPSSKGMTYSFIVDGHTIRYLTNHKWGLFFGVEKLCVRRLRTNFGDLQSLRCILI